MNKKPSSSAVNSTGSAGKKTPTEPRFLVVGKITRPHGVRGELKMEIRTRYPDWLAELDVLYLGRDANSTATEYTLEGMRFHRGELLVSLGKISDRDQAERLREQLVMIRLDQAKPLEEGEFYTYEILGMAVYTDTGVHLGEVIDIMETGANDVFMVDGTDRGLVLIPDVDEVILDIDPESRRVTIKPLAGLIDNYEDIQED